MNSKNSKEPFLILKFSKLGKLKISKARFYFFCFGLFFGAGIGVVAYYQ